MLRCIKQEEERVGLYLHETSRPALLSLLDNLLIVPRLAEIQAEANRCIEVDQTPSNSSIVLVCVLGMGRTRSFRFAFGL